MVGSYLWVPVEQQTPEIIAKVTKQTEEYQKWLEYKGITLRAAEDDWGDESKSRYFILLAFELIYWMYILRN